MFKRGNKCSQLNYLRSKTKLIKQNNNEAAVCLQAGQRVACNAKFIIKCGECCRERERGGATALTALKLTSLSLVKEGTARVKRCWSHVCNEGVLCCNDSALSLSSIRRPAQSATEWFYNLMIQISYLKSLYRLIPPLLMVTGDQLSQLSTGLWSQGRDVRIAITIRLSVTLPLMDVATLMMELLMTLSSGCTVVAGGWAGPRWLCFTDLQVSWDSRSPHSICSQALSYVTAPPPPSFSSDLV